MTTTIIPCVTQRGTPHASLAALGAKLHQLDLWAPIRTRLRIPQKTVRHTPLDKLQDLFLGLLAGARGVVEVNTRVRADPALYAAFGRPACADQSTIQATLNAVTPANLTQLEEALDEIYRTHSRGFHHAYATQLQVLDVDINGAPCGPGAEGATKGYFTRRRNQTGRQLGRVLASAYDEVVCARLYPGTTQLATALPELVAAAAATLQLTAAQRARTVIRTDAGGGTRENINTLLSAGYHYHGKDCSGVRAARLAGTVRTWMVDPRHPSREVGWVRYQRQHYVRPVVQVALRWRKKNQQWAYAVIVSSLSAGEVLSLSGPAPEGASAAQAGLLAYSYFYDQRGGGVETSFKEDNQGLGPRQRNKKHFAGQVVLEYLSQLAHNVLIWARRWLAEGVPALADWGLKRLVRDVWGIAGRVTWGAPGEVQGIVLNSASRLATQVLPGLQRLGGPAGIEIALGDP